VYFCLLCLNVVPLPPGKNPFAVQLNSNNNNNNNNNNNKHLDSGTNLRERKDHIWFKVQAVPVFHFD
jgi:hypothetical protein